MGIQHYRIVVTGKTLAGWETERAIAELAKLFGGDTAKASRLLSGKSSKLSKLLDKQGAERYKQKLHQAGVACLIEEYGDSAMARTQPAPPSQVTAPNRGQNSSADPCLAQPDPFSSDDSQPFRKNSTPLSLSLEPIATDIKTSSLQRGQMRCPKCGEVQEHAPECASCGIVISKYPSASDTAELNVTDPLSTSAEDESYLEQLKLFIGNNTDYYLPKFRHFMESDKKFNFSFNLAAFFLSITWLFHRKMYWPMLIVLLLPLALINISYLASTLVQIALTLGTAFFGNSLYYLHATALIDKLDDNDAIAQRGGTQPIMLTIAFTIVSLILIGAAAVAVVMNSEGGKTLNALHDQQVDMSKPGMQTLVTIKTQILMLKLATEAKSKTFKYPVDESDLFATLGIRGKQGFEDQWGTAMIYQRTDDGFFLSSAGPDQSFDTQDDLLVEHSDKK